jgi:AraC family transcriptional regulator
MNAPRTVIESNFALEQRALQGRKLELPALPDFSILYFQASTLAQFPAGTLLLINPNTSFQLAQQRGRAELLLVRLAPSFLIETATRLQLYRTASQLLFRQPLQPLSDARLQAALDAIASELASGASGWREVIAASINQLSVYLLRNHINVRRSDEIELSRVGIVDRRLRRAVELMHDNCGRELSLSEIAAAACLSEFHFARLFKKLTGLTPHAYLASLRVERARKLLVTTDLSISEIGARVGYTSQSHFTKVFRAAAGTTPKAFRAAANKLD